MPDLHTTAPTQFVEAGGTRYAYRPFGRKEGVPLPFMEHLFLSHARLFVGGLEL